MWKRRAYLYNRHLRTYGAPNESYGYTSCNQEIRNSFAWLQASCGYRASRTRGCVRVYVPGSNPAKVRIPPKRLLSPKGCVFIRIPFRPDKVCPRVPGALSLPSEEAFFTIAALKLSVFERLHVFQHVALRITVVGSFAVLTLAHATRMILVAAVCASKQRWVGIGCFAMAMRAFRWIIFWECC